MRRGAARCAGVQRASRLTSYLPTNLLTYSLTSERRLAHAPHSTTLLLGTRADLSVARKATRPVTLTFRTHTLTPTLTLTLRPCVAFWALYDLLLVVPLLLLP